jgi:hypothetical protein
VNNAASTASVEDDHGRLAPAVLSINGNGRQPSLGDAWSYGLRTASLKEEGSA